MNFKKVISLFLLSFFLMGGDSRAEDPQVSYSSSGPAVAAPSAVGNAAAKWSDGWYQGAEGYKRAVLEYQQTHKAMVVYVSVTWCPYCRRFEKEVLSSPLVQNELSDKIKVMINPESGGRENALAFQYGVRGFPSFFLHPPRPAGAVQLYTGVTPGQFVEFFKQILK